MKPPFIPPAHSPAARSCHLQPGTPASPLPTIPRDRAGRRSRGSRPSASAVVHRPAPGRGFQAQPPLLKGGSLTWNEMRLHLPSSTHSGDKQSAIPRRPRLRQGTDRAVHLASRARGRQARGSQAEVGEGCKRRLCARRQWVKFPRPPAPFSS